MNAVLGLGLIILMSFALGFIMHIFYELPYYLKYWEDLSDAKKELRERFGNKKLLINPTQEDMTYVSNVAYKYGVCIGRKLSGGMAIVDGKIETHKSLVITGRL